MLFQLSEKEPFRVVEIKEKMNNEQNVQVTKLLNQSKLYMYKCQLIQLNNQMAMNTTVCIDELLILKWQAEFLCVEEETHTHTFPN